MIGSYLCCNKRRDIDMDVKICDKCKKQITLKGVNDDYSYIILKNSKAGEEIRYDLCNDCCSIVAKQLKNW